ncbi:MAG: radical SAM protein [Firmicutes bacterium]|nr:radical SAM protein [Bacillota bacterium]NLL89167.1 radical SAM protein [Bacillota bacterium]
MKHQPSYLHLTKQDFAAWIASTKEHLTNCTLCPRECRVDRTRTKGYCQAGAKLKVSSFGPHFGEERELVGSHGSGTIFFAHCSLRCVYCQNYQLSFGGEGEPCTSEQLAAMMLLLQDHYGCANINLVTPTHYVHQIIEAIYTASQKGLRLPIVYNCGGYESVGTLKLLEGIVDIYMPDLKYGSEKMARDYSQASDYFARTSEALVEMDRQVGPLELDEYGLAYKGLLIRHLVLPGGLEETKRVLDFIKAKLSPGVLVNLMDQYYPSYKAFNFPELNRRISQSEFLEALQYAQKLELRLAVR